MSDEALIQELREMGEHPSRADLPMGRTLRDAADRIEQHEAYKQDVSDAVEHCRACSDPEAWTRIKFELERFIIPKPDPLVETLNEMPNVCEDEFDANDAAKLREALAKHGFKIVETDETFTHPDSV